MSTSHKHRFAPAEESAAAVAAGDTLGRVLFKELVRKQVVSIDGTNLLLVRLYDLVEKPFLEELFKLTGGNQSKAAAMLGLNRTTVRKLYQRYGLKP